MVDTSVLVAAAVSVLHVHHRPSQAAYLAADKNTSSCAGHGLAEVYAVLTRLPGKQRISCDQALLFVDDLREQFATIALAETEYYSAITDAAAEGIVGSTVYDAVIARCALKGKATVLLHLELGPFSSPRARGRETGMHAINRSRGPR